jgi:glycosyltransferase involved in cell wall biosynthesis
MAYLFWTSAAFLAYTFAGYPLALWFLSILRDRTHHRAPILPTVSLIIPIHNEAALVGSKIQNSLELDYPSDKLEIIVASDNSQDATPDIVRSYSTRGVKLVENQERLGKHHAQMVARDASHGEILVFTDVAVHLEPDAVRKIVANFADPKVGCVSSEDQVVAGKKSGLGERSYIKFEMWLRRLESRVNSLVNVSGSFFAARRELCEKWHPRQSSDFFVALHGAAQGLRAVLDTECFGYYGLVPSEKAEFYRKVRTIVHGMDLLFSHVELLNPVKYGLFAWQLMSHKLFRWLIPFGVVALLVSNSFLWKAGEVYRIALLFQVIFYGLGLLALAVSGLSRFMALKVAAFFVMGNAATSVAWMKYISGEKYVTWQPSRRA